MKEKNRNHNLGDMTWWLLLYCLPYLVLALLFFVATMELPKEFYSFLRILVFFALHMCNIVILMVYTKSLLPIIMVNTITSVLFNPIFPFYFNKEIWVVIDIVCVIMMILSAIYNFFYFVKMD